MKKVLVLRPEPGATATVQRAKELGLEAVTVPLFAVEPIAWKAPDPGSFDGLLLTSANAVRHAGRELEKLRGVQVYAVGEATAEAARSAGFDIASTGNAGIDRLLGSLEGDLRLLHLCGKDKRNPSDARQEITSMPVYWARPLPNPDFGQARGTVALVHSPLAAERLSQLVKERGSMSIAAISPAAAEAAGSGWGVVESAPKPTDEALLALAARLCNKPE